MTKSTFAVTNAFSRTVVFVVQADSKDHAMQLAATGLERTRTPSSWSAWTIDELPADLQAEAAAWKSEA